MSRSAVALPDLRSRGKRNSFASMKRVAPITCCERWNWPTSAMSGGFRPPGRHNVRRKTYSVAHLNVGLGLMGTKKFLQSESVAECFGAPTGSDGEGSAQVSVCHARPQIRSTQELVEESGVEAITRADRIDDSYRYRGRAVSVPIPNRNGAAGAHFDRDRSHLLCEPRKSGFYVVSPGNLHGFALIG